MSREPAGGLRVQVPYTQEQLETQPDFNDEAYRSDPDAVVLR